MFDAVHCLFASAAGVLLKPAVALGMLVKWRETRHGGNDIDRGCVNIVDVGKGP